jgi:hypothetical protein
MGFVRVLPLKFSRGLYLSICSCTS